MARASRQERIERARQHIARNPEWSRDRINRSLRNEYGIGLRKKFVDQIKREVLRREKRAPRLPRERLIERIAPRLRPRSREYTRLRNRGFLPWEAEELSKMPGVVPYWQDMQADRWRGFRNAMNAGWTRRDWEASIVDMYYARRFFVPGTRQLSPWAMLRAWREEAIATGEYVPPKRVKKKGKPKVTREQVESLRARRRETELERYDRMRGR